MPNLDKSSTLKKVLDENLIKEKLKRILNYLDELKPILEISYKEYRKNYTNYRTTERNIQLIVDTAVDVNDNFILAKNANPPADYYESFVRMNELGILSLDLSKKLASSTGLRNKLVHEYEKIDDQLLYLEAKKNLKNYLEYVKLINGYLNKF